MTKLNISPDLALPLDAITQTIVVYGGKGMGKTNFASVLAEEFDRNRLHFSLIDPLGVSWGLQSSADGKSAGLELLVLGGIHGDIPIDPHAGAIVADLVVDESVNVVIDISREKSGKMWSMGDKIRFVTDYSIRVYERQGEKRQPFMQIYDEAGRFVPQAIPHGAPDITKCVGAIEQLVEWGRNVGVGVTLITQRSARMNKSVSELAEMMIAFRTVGPNSLAAIEDWLGENTEKEARGRLLNQIRSLPVGTAVIVSPGWLGIEKVVHIRKRETFDSSATPKPGAQVRAPVKRAEIDVSKFRERMATTIERAKSEDPTELRRRIVELEKQLRARPTTVPTPVEKIVEKPVPVFQEGQLDQLSVVTKALAETGAQLQSISMDIRQALDAATAAARAKAVPVPRPTSRPIPSAKPVAAPTRAHATEPENSDLTRPQQAILDALATFEQLGIRQPHKSNVAVFANQSPKSSGFTNNLGRLRSLGYIDYPGSGLVALTNAGREQPNVEMNVGTLEDLHQAWFTKLSRPKVAILQALIAVYPGALEKGQLAEQAGQGPTSSGYTNNLGSLRSLGLISYPRSGMVAATELLFPDLPR